MSSRGKVVSLARRRVDAQAAMRSTLVREPVSSSRQDFWAQPPLKVYHGTSSRFEAFSPSRVGVVSTPLGQVAVERHGIFFAENRDFAMTFGDNVIGAYLHIENPLLLDEGFDVDTVEVLHEAGLSRRHANQLEALPAISVWQAFDGQAGHALVKAAKRAGYDGALIEEEAVGLGDDEVPQRVWVVFDDAQVFSRTWRFTFTPRPRPARS